MYRTVNPAQLAGLVAKGIVTVAINPVEGTLNLASAGLKIASAFAPDVTNHLVCSLDYARFREFLTTAHPDNLNHDLDKLIKGAIIRAAGFIRHKYIDAVKQENNLNFWNRFSGPLKELEDKLNTLEKELAGELDYIRYQKTDLDNYLTGDYHACFDDLTDYLFTISLAEQQEWSKLKAYFRQELPDLFDLCFKEALKDDNNLKAFKAFHIWVMEKSLANQEILMQGQENIKAAIAQLKNDSNDPIIVQLDQDIKNLNDLLSDNFKKLFQDLGDIKEALGRVEDKIDDGFRIITDKIASAHVIPQQLTEVPNLYVELVGREEDLGKLYKLVSGSNRPVLLRSIGGIGKTSLAKQLFQQYRSGYNHVAWIEVTKQDTVVNGQMMSGSLIEIMANHPLLFHQLGLPYDPKTVSETDRFQKVISALQNLEGPNMLIIDNAGEDTRIQYLPAPPNWHVLITSRMALSGYECFNLDKLSPEASLELFRKYHPYQQTEEVYVLQLLEAIDYHTLTIELFAKTLNAHYGSLTVQALLKKIQSNQLNDPDLQRRIETDHSPKETEMFLHLMMAFDCTQLSTEEKIILNQLALLPPESYSIPDQLNSWLGYEGSEHQKTFHNALRSLDKKGWITIHNTTLELHRLHHQVISYQLPFSWENSEAVIDAIAQALETFNHPDVLSVYPLRKYGEFLLSKIPESFSHQPLISELQNNLALVYKDLGKLEKAEELLSKALESNLANFGDKHPNVATTQSNLALVYRQLGKLEKAEELLYKALESDLANFGDKHPKVAIRQSNLALVYKDSGKLEKAEELLNKTLESSLANFGDKHPKVATRQSNLAIVYKDSGKLEKAEELLNKALESDLATFGDKHPKVAIRQSNLAIVYRQSGKLEKAEELLNKALESGLANFGDKHPKVATRQSNLAMVYRQSGELKKAEELLNKALESDLVNFGDKHPKVAIRQSNLAMVYIDSGKLEKAEELLDKALKSDLVNFGDKHSKVATRQSHLALVYQDLGEFEKAISLLKNAERIFLDIYGEQHPNTKWVREWLAYLRSL